MPSTEIRYAVIDHVAEITLNGPSNGNAIDLDCYRALCEALDRAGKSDEVHAILLRGGADDFSVGEDFDYLAGLEDAGRFGEWTRGFRGWVPFTWHNPKFVVASVRGRAMGIACELALLADVTFAEKQAAFGHPETQRGIVGHTIWPWLVGPKVAKEYLATGGTMSGEVAAQKGLINAALDADRLDAHVRAFVTDLATMPDGTPGANKKRINWAYRDVSRVLHDDRQYDVDFEWTVAARKVDQAFYDSVKEQGVSQAVKSRDANFHG
jgi:enoyl-CoA hydratase